MCLKSLDPIFLLKQNQVWFWHPAGWISRFKLLNYSVTQTAALSFWSDPCFLSAKHLLEKPSHKASLSHIIIAAAAA